MTKCSDGLAFTNTYDVSVNLLASRRSAICGAHNRHPAQTLEPACPSLCDACAPVPRPLLQAASSMQTQAAAQRAMCGAAAVPAAPGRRPAAAGAAAFGGRAGATRMPVVGSLSRRELLGSGAAAAALLPPLAAQASGGAPVVAAAAAPAAAAAADVQLRPLQFETDANGVQRLALQPEGEPQGSWGCQRSCCMAFLACAAVGGAYQPDGPTLGQFQPPASQPSCCVCQKLITPSASCRVEQLALAGAQRELAGRWRQRARGPAHPRCVLCCAVLCCAGGSCRALQSVLL